MGLNLSHVALKTIIKELEEVGFLRLDAGFSHAIGVELLDIARVEELEEILKLVDVGRVRPEELVELRIVVVKDIEQEDAFASIGLGHGLPQYGSELVFIDWIEVEGGEHVLLKYVGMLLEDLYLISQSVIDDNHRKQAW